MLKMSSVLLIFSKMTTIFAEIRRFLEISSIFPSPQNLKKSKTSGFGGGQIPIIPPHTHVLFMFADINVHCIAILLKFSVSNKNLRLFFCVMTLSGNGSFVREFVYDVISDMQTNGSKMDCLTLFNL